MINHTSTSEITQGDIDKLLTGLGQAWPKITTARESITARSKSRRNLQ